MSFGERLKFLSGFVANPGMVGSVTPSSHSLARAFVGWIDWPNVRVVVEYGAATGPLTAHIRERMRPGTKVIAIELNTGFAAYLSKRFPDIRVYQDSVKNVQAICAQEGHEKVDAIVSGLPWTFFPPEMQTEMLHATVSVLRPEGQFTTYAYLSSLIMPGGRRFKNNLPRFFSQVDASTYAWLSLPPAVLYRCRV